MAKNYNILPINHRFYELFVRSKLSQKDFGQLFGLTQSHISKLFLGRSNLTPMLKELLKKIMGVREEWLERGELPMFRENLETENPPIPVLADIPAGDWRYWIDSYPTGQAESTVSFPGVNGEYLFAVRVDGDSMEPLLRDGDVVIVDPVREFRNGLMVVRHHWGYKIRNVAKKSSRVYLLVPQNPRYEPEEIAIDEETRFYVPVKIVCLHDI